MNHYIIEIKNNMNTDVFRDELIYPSLAFNPATYKEINRLFDKYRLSGIKIQLVMEPVSYQSDLFAVDDLPF